MLRLISFVIFGVSPIALLFAQEQGEAWDDYCRYHNGAMSTCAILSNSEMGCTPEGPACGRGEVPPVAIFGIIVDEAATTITSTSTTSTPSPRIDVNQIRDSCDHYCQAVNNDEDSYCKWWLENAVCIGGDQPCGTPSLCELPRTSNPTEGAEEAEGDGLYYEECDVMCQSINNDDSSFCKWWLDIPVCKHGNQPCGNADECRSKEWPLPRPAPQDTEEVPGHPRHSPACDSHCQSLNDDSSYCKWWKAEPVCRGGDQPCGPSDCSPGDFTTSTAPPERHSGPDMNCDAYCRDLNPTTTAGESYCKWWMHVPVCKNGDQQCNPSVCSQYSTSVP
ncbi:hypothetical protein FOL47_004210 [Perkinsus chesapeaki]|uniref:Immunoglobulin super DCC subclass member n=1 Tax=Perkinsus chesapeaki TaxID=330153 RepID=A0A7J6M443_PERCH|nr:hypothetical protein FOL47_004210 [Perkinsus chesapeaki]